MLSHKVYKKGYSATELFPWMKGNIPDSMEEERVLKARRLLNTVASSEEACNQVKVKIEEEIEIELAKEEPDQYVVSQLRKLISG